MKLHHIGMIVADLEMAAHWWENTLAAEVLWPVYRDDTQGAEICFLQLGNSEAIIELVAPYAEDSPLRRFLAQRGGGLHHICFSTNDLGTAIKVLRISGAIQVTRPVPATAFNERLICFMYTKGKVLLELVECDEGLENVAILARR